MREVVRKTKININKKYGKNFFSSSQGTLFSSSFLTERTKIKKWKEKKSKEREALQMVVKGRYV